MKRNRLLYSLIALFVIFADQLTKWLAVTFLKGEKSFPLIPGILHFTYLENPGAAFGSLQDHRWVFLLFSTAALIVMLWVLYGKRQILRHVTGGIALALLIGGGVGNMIDRLLLGYVVDFIELRFVRFAIFNLADSCVTVGAVLLMIYILWFSETGKKKSPEKAGAAQGSETEKTDSGKESGTGGGK